MASTPTTGSPAPLAPATPSGSAWWTVFFTPHAAFSRQAQKPQAWLLVLLLLGASVAPAVAFVTQADVKVAMEKQMKRTGSYEKLPPENRDQVMNQITSAMTYLGPAGAFLKRAFYLFGIGLLAWFLLKATRPELRFVVVLAAVALGMLPVLLQDTLETLVFFVRDATTVNIDAPLRSHLGTFLPKDISEKVRAAASGVDVFGLWVAGLVGFGLKVVAQTKSMVPYFITFGAHLALVGIAVAAA